MASRDVLSEGIQYIKGIGEKRAALFASLGIYTIGDLLFYFPRAYEDWQNVREIASAPEGEKVCLRVTVLSDMTARGTHSGKTLYSTLARDESGYVGLVFFNNKYAQYTFRDGAEIFLYGKLMRNENGASEMFNPDYAPAAGFSGGLRAIYPQTAGLNSRAISRAVASALERFGALIPESLPDAQIKKYRLKSLRDAVRLIHFPASYDDVNAARRRLIYEELLTLQLGLLLRGKGERGSTRCVMRQDKTAEFIARLPFALTGAQRRAVAECAADMKKDEPMRRLLQGDVGSGKTAVAACLMSSAAANGYQSVLMAPTEVLARQHFETLKKMFDGSGVTVDLLTGSMTAKEKKAVKQRLASGETDILTGTHAVITADTAYARLGLVVTDEQHRFGVMQRAALREKGEDPHVLVMSATPIPRTLSLIIYGDLDISVLDEKPAGRIPVKTFRVDGSYRRRLYDFIGQRAAAGEKTFIVCPRIEEDDGDVSEKAAAESYAKSFAAAAPKHLKTAVLHGKMPQKEKDAVMEAFCHGDTDVLICTVVIEVGVDVPDATVMVIENAECFGLSQLHQLRGRVGRGRRQSYCVLVSDGKGDSLSRLDVLCEHSDGFEIARQDLERRGPGDFFGARQSGLPALKLADLMADSRILYAARAEAESILKADPLLRDPSYALIREKTDKLFTDIS